MRKQPVKILSPQSQPKIEVLPAPDCEFERLSGRELECARLVAKGFSNKEIAHLLGISHWTVAAHLKATFLKVGVGRRVELAYLMRGQV
jgi:DNA-binding CsgD family transcriptional regulator